MEENNKMLNYSVTEIENLNILADAICDVGYWSWWASTDFSKSIQIEFGGTQLIIPFSENEEPFSAQIAIQFKNPKSIAFLAKEKLKENEIKWFDDLHNDKIEPLTCSYENFTFVDDSLMKEIIGIAKTINVVQGYSPLNDKFYSEKYKLVFLTGCDDYGFAVASEEIKFMTRHGVFDIQDISKFNSAWWKYWNEYWNLRGTKKALKKDYACEATIPIKDVNNST